MLRDWKKHFILGRQAEPEEVVEKLAEQKPQSDQELLLSLLQKPGMAELLKTLAKSM